MNEYGKLVVDAKASVNDAIPHIVNNALKTALEGSMQAYADGVMVWNLSLKDSQLLRGDSFFIVNSVEGTYLDTKYHFTKRTSGIANKQVALNTIWAVAKAHLMHATALEK